MVELGDVVAMPLPLGGYGACQVTGGRDGLLAVCALDWYSGSPPALEELRGAGALVVDHHSWEGRALVMMVGASDALPPGFVRLGRLPPRPDLPGSCDSYGPWDAFPLQVVHQRHWDLWLPAEAKAAYKNAPGRHVEADFGGAPVRRPGRLSRLDLREHRSDTVLWAGLDKLPQVTTLLWAGAERGLVRALESRPMITELVWEDPPEEVDLSVTGLRGLVFPWWTPRRVVPPPGLLSLRLGGAPPEVVDAALDGRWVRLAVVAGDWPLVPEGLRGVRDLEVEVAGDLAVPGGLCALESLWVRWSGPYGAITGLAEVPRLHTLDLVDAYGVEAGMLPAPDGALRRLGVKCLRSGQVEPIERRYQGSEVEVRLRGAKSDTWLRANIDNPLCDWVDEHQRGGAAACAAYSVAAQAIGGLGADDPAAAADAREILRTFVEALNEVEARYAMIDSVLREEAGDAFMRLAERAGVPRTEAAAWFDEWRDF